MPRLALVGDYSPAVIAHRAIPLALALAQREGEGDLSWDWVPTRSLHAASVELAPYSAIWLVPASPYENTAGALDAVRFARESRRPFLGTCGGFQHALVEFARNVLGVADADHAETNPTGTATQLVVTALACSLVEKTDALHLSPGSRLREIYGADRICEGYHCRYGPSAAHRPHFERAGLRFTACDDAHEIRAGELPTTIHPFFIGTLFQPERAALRGETPPLVRAFVRAALALAP